MESWLCCVNAMLVLYHVLVEFSPFNTPPPWNLTDSLYLIVLEGAVL